MASVRITFTKEEEYLVEYLRNKTKPKLFIKDLIKEAMYHEYYRMTGNIPVFFEQIAENSSELNTINLKKNESDEFIDEDDVGVDISDMEEF